MNGITATRRDPPTEATVAIRRPVARDKRRAALEGARAMLPWLVGLVPNAIVIGVISAHSSIPTLAGWLTGPLVFTASAQVAVIELLDAGAAPFVVVLVAVAINLRLILYSATMAQHWTGTSRFWRATAAYFLVDPVAAVGADGYRRSSDREVGHFHYLGGALLLWSAWVTAMAVGATAGTLIPSGLHLEIGVPLFLVGQLAARPATRASRWGVGVAGVAGLFATAVPLRLGAVLAMAAGVVVVLSIDGRTNERGA